MLSAFLGGAATMGFLVVAVTFARHWRQTRDLFFVWFALAFFILAAARVATAMNPNPQEFSLFSIVRMFAYLLIAGAILQKNRNR